MLGLGACIAQLAASAEALSTQTGAMSQFTKRATRASPEPCASRHRPQYAPPSVRARLSGRTTERLNKSTDLTARR